MSIFDELFDDRGDDDRERWTRVAHDKTCMRCGGSGLQWLNDGRAWYLADDEGYEHECKDEDVQAHIADDFDVLP